MKFIIIQRICTVLFILILLALFIFPSTYIQSIYEQASTYTSSAIGAAQNDDMPLAGQYAADIVELLNTSSNKIKRFVNHSVVNEAMSEAIIAQKMCLLDDKNAAVAALIALQGALDSLYEIEHFKGNTLL